MEKRLEIYAFCEKVMYIVITVAASVILPQLLHLIGKLTGTNAALGQILLPMHLPVMILGFCLGPWAGFAAGLAAPIAGFLLTGMPASALLPYIAAEISGYGFFAGLLKNTKLSPILKVMSVQALGRLMRVLAAVVLTSVFTDKPFAAAFAGMAAGLPGVILQILLVPYFVKIIGRAK
ncbi:MAG: ECF transporter S component [Clostridiales bacterium]|nr:ECF transporter S component [Clostridiales bacterium]